MNPQIIIATVLFTLLAIAPVSGATTKKKSVTTTTTFSSPTTCNGAHGVARWAAKIDSSRPPADKSQTKAVTPSQMYAWPGVGTKIKLAQSSKRIPAEQKWYVVKGKVDGIKVEADGDIHIELVDSNGNKPGTVGVEIPCGQIWSEFRKLAFSWTTQTFPFSFKSSKGLTVSGRHVIAVTGKAFYDVDHAPTDRSNQRPKPFHPGYSVWELHPVMGMTR
jgi:hypothetical protein